MGGPLPEAESFDDRVLGVASRHPVRRGHRGASAGSPLCYRRLRPDTPDIPERASWRYHRPLVVVGFIDAAILLFIRWRPVRRRDTRNRNAPHRPSVIYTGVIAMVRKAIIFRTGEYSSEQAALTAAAAYTLIILGLAALLLVEL